MQRWMTGDGRGDLRRATRKIGESAGERKSEKRVWSVFSDVMRVHPKHSHDGGAAAVAVAAGELLCRRILAWSTFIRPTFISPSPHLPRQSTAGSFPHKGGQPSSPARGHPPASPARFRGFHLSFDRLGAPTYAAAVATGTRSPPLLTAPCATLMHCIQFIARCRRSSLSLSANWDQSAL